MAAFVSAYWYTDDLTSTQNYPILTYTTATNYVVTIKSAEVYTPKFMCNGKVFPDAKAMKLYKNEQHSRSCWYVPKRIEPYEEERRIVCQIRRPLRSQTQIRHHKRRQYLHRLRKGF